MYKNSKQNQQPNSHEYSTRFPYHITTIIIIQEANTTFSMCKGSDVNIFSVIMKYTVYVITKSAVSVVLHLVDFKPKTQIYDS